MKFELHCKLLACAAVIFAPPHFMHKTSLERDLKTIFFFCIDLLLTCHSFI